MPRLSPRKLQIGPDRVMVSDDRLVIRSHADMPGWEVRRHRKSLVHFGGRTWQITKKKSDSGDRMILYELSPWTPRVQDLVGREIHYGGDYVELREHERARNLRREIAAPVLLLLSPLIGLLGAETKRRIERHSGVGAMAATRRSVFLEYLLVFVATALASISAMVGIFGRIAPIPMKPMVILILIVLPDAVIRYGRLIEEEQYPPGFYQWLWRRKQRR